MVSVLLRQTVARMNNRRIALQGIIGVRFKNALDREFQRQSDVVVARYLRRVKAPGEGLMTELEIRALMEIFNISEAQMYQASAELADDLLGVEQPAEPRPLPRRVRTRIASRVKRVDAVTRKAISQVIKDGRRDGLTTDQIAENLRDKVRNTYQGRAQTIARTELAIIDQEAAHDRYRSAGVRHVFIQDGPDCGWRRHNDPDKADGSTRTIEDAMDHPIAHPNCVRSSGPVVDSIET